MAHVISVAVHLLPLVALVGFEWPDLSAEPEVPMRRVVEVRLEAQRPPKNVMFQAEHDSDVKQATTAVASGAAMRTRGGVVTQRLAPRSRAAARAARQLRPRRRAAVRRSAAAEAPHSVARQPHRAAPRPAEAVLASAHVAAHGRTLALAHAAVDLTPAPAPARPSVSAPAVVTR